MRAKCCLVVGAFLCGEGARAAAEARAGWQVSIASAVVNDDNASLKSMDTAQLLDLFSPAGAGAGAGTGAAEDGAVGADAEGKAAGGGKLAQVKTPLVYECVSLRLCCLPSPTHTRKKCS